MLERTPDVAGPDTQRSPREEVPAAKRDRTLMAASPAPPPPPAGATMTALGSGKEAVFAGGLIGGQSAFSWGDYNFDPLGLSEKFSPMLPWFREAELKHGRVAMLAFVGLIAPELGTLQGLPPKCAAAGIGGELRIVEAHNACVADPLPLVNMSPMLVILLAAGLIEVVTTVQKITLGWGLTIENAGDYPGRKEIGAYLKQLPKDETAMVVLKLQELKHCRLAMIGFGGAWTQACLTAHGFPWTWLN